MHSMNSRTSQSLTWGILSILIFLAVVMMPACNSSSSDSTGEETDTDTTTQGEVTQNLQEVITEVPEPSQLPAQLELTGAEFDEKLPNPPASAEQYQITNDKAALNLGVYATDIGYVSVYGQVTNATDYIEAVEMLGDKLGVSSALDPNLQERFKSNLSNVEELTKIVDEAIANSDKYLKENERQNIAALIFTGTFIEGLYISTQLVTTYPEDLLPTKEARDEVLVGISRLIVDQDKPLGDLIEALQALPQEGEAKTLVEDLSQLKEIYEKLDIQEKIEQNQGDFIINDETIKGITEKVKEIRTKIVS